MALSILLAACSGDAGRREGVEVRDSAGIRIVENRSAPADTVRIERPALRIGSGGLHAEEAYLFQLISDLAITDDRVFVVDNRGRRIAVFDTEGTWQYDVGREGTGPGEHRGPIRISLHGDTLFVWDAILRRLNRFTVAGEFIDMHMIAERYGRAPVVPFADGYIDELEWGQHMDPAPAAGALVQRSAAGEVTDTLLGPYPVPEIGWQWTDDSQQSGMMVNPPVFAARPAWLLRDSRLLWSRPETGEIHVYDAMDGSLERVIRIGGSPAATTAADREAHVDASIQRFNIDPARRSAILAATTFAPVRPAFVTFIADDRGELWVAGHDPHRIERHYIASDWFVVDADGALRRTVAFPETFELLAVHRGRAWGITRDADGVETVEAFDLPSSVN